MSALVAFAVLFVGQSAQSLSPAPTSSASTQVQVIRWQPSVAPVVPSSYEIQSRRWWKLRLPWERTERPVLVPTGHTAVAPTAQIVAAPLHAPAPSLASPQGNGFSPAPSPSPSPSGPTSTAAPEPPLVDVQRLRSEVSDLSGLVRELKEEVSALRNQSATSALPELPSPVVVPGGAARVDREAAGGAPPSRPRR